MAFSSGIKVGPYEVLSKIGAGGMGEVYLAHDTRLGRKVALKVLKENTPLEEQARNRFLKEAKAASSLNNPHIVTVYDIISQDHSDVIVMEYLEGESLRKMLSHGKLESRRALGIAADVAAALAAAHNVGIIHRDIKPENIVLTRTNVTKVLDFGLAKLVLKDSDQEESQLTTATTPATHSGMVLGTVSYMSPEQAQGKQIDNRTDIFSLGIVLFEMLSGKRPFQGNSTVDTLHAILHLDPMNTWAPDVKLPNDVKETLSRALAKSPEERYQHAGDFAFDLHKLATTNGKNVSSITNNRLGTQSSLWRFVSVALAVFASLMAFAFWKSRQSVPSRVADEGLYEKFTLNPLTVDPGYEWDPTFAPDGETIAYVSDRTGNFEIFLKQVSGGPDVNLTNNKADDVQPAFSPDGKQIAFVSTRSSRTDLHYPGTDAPLVGGDIWIMPALGGSAKRIVEEANFPSWSPDGSEILFSSGRWFDQKLYTVSPSGGAKREIPVRFAISSPARLINPVYSPSGHWIAFTANNVMYIVSSKGGEARVLLRGVCPAWLGQNKIVYSNAEPGKNFSLWETSFSDERGTVLGDSRPLTIGRGEDLYPSPSRDGSKIAFSSAAITGNLEVMPFDADGRGQTGEPRAITIGNDLIYFANFSPDGRMITFASLRGASSHIWRTDPDSAEVQLTSDPKYFDGYPRYSPDGSQIGFIRRDFRNLDAGDEIWIMSADGANPHPTGISQHIQAGTAFFAWFPSGLELFHRLAADRQIHRFDLASKTDRPLTNEPLIMPILSLTSDGKWLLYQTTIRGNADIEAVPTQGGTPRFVVSTPHQDYHPFVSPSGKWLYFGADHKNLYRVPGPAQNWLAMEPEKVTNFPESGLFIEDPQISRDGKQFLYSRVKTTGDIWILNFAK